MRAYARIIRHFAFSRSLEVFALQASPVLGLRLGGLFCEGGAFLKPALLLLGSLLLTFHIFILNDWMGCTTDLRAPQRATKNFATLGLVPRQVAQTAGALLVLSCCALAYVGLAPFLLGGAITILSLLYSCSLSYGKSVPGVASVHHLLGGILHFLLGYGAFHPIDSKGLATSLFFGLVFAAGHLNQEVRDYEGDRLSEIRTTAVVYGPRIAFLASQCLFTAAYATLMALAARGLLSRILLLSAVGWVVHLGWAKQAVRRGLSFATAEWLQRRYRLLLAILGLGMFFG